jgi:hypothetical protein
VGCVLHEIKPNATALTLADAINLYAVLAKCAFLIFLLLKNKKRIFADKIHFFTL